MSFSSLKESITPVQFGIGLTVAQLLVAAPILLKLKNEDQQDSTSRAAVTTVASDTSVLPPKLANLVIYGPSAAISYWQMTIEGASTKIPKLLLTHFGKKAVELFVLQKPKKSGSDEEMIPTAVAAQTSVFYSVGTYLILTQALPMPEGIDFAQIVFWLGQFGNAIHVQLLESNKASTTSRALPDSGLFRSIAAPHHIFEVLSWLGIAFSARNQSAYLQAGLVTAVLGYQAKKLNDTHPLLGNNTESTDRSAGTDVIKPKRWNLIPYIY